LGDRTTKNVTKFTLSEEQARCQSVSQSAKEDPVITDPLFWMFNLHCR